MEIENLLLEIKNLREENNRLKALLAKHNISY